MIDESQTVSATRARVLPKAVQPAGDSTALYVTARGRESAVGDVTVDDQSGRFVRSLHATPPGGQSNWAVHVPPVRQAAHLWLAPRNFSAIRAGACRNVPE